MNNQSHTPNTGKYFSNLTTEMFKEDQNNSMSGQDEPSDEDLYFIAASMQAKFIIEGIGILGVGCVGLIINAFALFTLMKKQVMRNFHMLMCTLAVYDFFHLISDISCFAIPEFSNHYRDRFLIHVIPILLPFTQIMLTGSCYTTVAITIERFLAVRHPFLIQRRNIKARMFTIPVLVYSIAYNIPRFFELHVGDKCLLEAFNETIHCNKFAANETDDLQFFDYISETSTIEEEYEWNPYYLTISDIRRNKTYIWIYVNTMNLCFNMLVPFITMGLLNYQIYKALKNSLSNRQHRERLSATNGTSGLEDQKLLMSNEAKKQQPYSKQAILRKLTKRKTFCLKTPRKGPEENEDGIEFERKILYGVQSCGERTDIKEIDNARLCVSPRLNKKPSGERLEVQFSKEEKCDDPNINEKDEQKGLIHNLESSTFGREHKTIANNSTGKEEDAKCSNKQNFSKDRKRVKTCSLSPQKTTTYHSNSSGKDNNNFLRKREARITRASLAITVMFVFCHTPRCLPNIMEMFIKSSEMPKWLPILVSVNHLLITMNSALNFLFYLSLCAAKAKKSSSTKNNLVKSASPLGASAVGTLPSASAVIEENGPVRSAGNDTCTSFIHMSRRKSSTMVQGGYQESKC